MLMVLDPQARGTSPGSEALLPGGKWPYLIKSFQPHPSPLLLTFLFDSLSYRIPFKIGQPKKQIVPKTVSNQFFHSETHVAFV